MLHVSLYFAFVMVAKDAKAEGCPFCLSIPINKGSVSYQNQLNYLLFDPKYKQKHVHIYHNILIYIGWQITLDIIVKVRSNLYI